jgi:uncharacterized integral membrane protein
VADDRKWIGEGDSGGELERRHRWTAKQITSLVILAVLVVFVLQNAHTADVTLFVTTFSFPMWFVLGGTVIVSFLAGWLFAGRRRSRHDDHDRH